MKMSSSNIKKFLMFQETELSFISGKGNPKKLLIFQEVTFQARKKIHPEKISYNSGNKKNKKISHILSKESCSYIFGNGNPKKLFIFQEVTFFKSFFYFGK